jgi:pyrroline-5-carboxylate reductase
MDYIIGVIGCGNMGRSLIGGLIASGVSPARITAIDADPAQEDVVRSRWGVAVAPDPRALARRADVVVLAVKPQVMRSVAEAIGAEMAGSPTLVVSIAAGIRIRELLAWLGGDAAVVRVMPNTPALVASAASALYAGPGVSAAHRAMAEAVMSAVGTVLWIDDEALMDSVTAVSGSGPAYVFLLIEAMEKAACALGLPPQTARLLSVHTTLGAARMALEGTSGPGELRAQVTSPGGTTERALQVLSEGGFEALVERAIRAARDRAVELAETHGQGR